MKISKGILVFMKENGVGNLYKLEGRTKIDQATVASVDAADFTRLWHQRLGHISKRGMKVLADRKLLPSLKSVDLKFCEHCVLFSLWISDPTEFHSRLSTNSIRRLLVSNGELYHLCWISGQS